MFILFDDWTRNNVPLPGQVCETSVFEGCRRPTAQKQLTDQFVCPKAVAKELKKNIHITIVSVFEPVEVTK